LTALTEISGFLVKISWKLKEYGVISDVPYGLYRHATHPFTIGKLIGKV